MAGGTSRRAVLAGLTTVGIVGARTAHASNFYQGKTITVLCGFNPGGGVDLGTRLIADNIGAHIPGNPTVIVQHMEGAGGLISANYLVAKAHPDGLTLAVPGRSWVLKPALGFANARFDAMKLAYIGSTGATNCVAYVNASAGVRTAEELKASKRKIVFGALPTGTVTAAVPRLLSQLGWPIDVVAGYSNTSRIVLAMDQKEVDAIYTPEASLARRRDLIETGRIIPLIQTVPTLPNVPTANSLVEPGDRPIMAIAHDQVSVGMPIVAPPGTPLERVDILRTAFMAMTKTQTYKDHAKRIDEPFDMPISGPELEIKIREMISNITPATITAYSKL